LVFNVEKVFKQVKAAYEDAYLVKCVYEKKNKEQRLKELLNANWHKYVANNSNKARKDLMDDLGKQVMLLASYFKHPSFSEEKEQRIVVILDSWLDNDVKFREGRFSLIPYIELPVSKTCIQKICIGPTSNKELSKKSLEMFLEKSYEISFAVFEVAFSKTPYRPW